MLLLRWDTLWVLLWAVMSVVALAFAHARAHRYSDRLTAAEAATSITWRAHLASCGLVLLGRLLGNFGMGAVVVIDYICFTILVIVGIIAFIIVLTGSLTSSQHDPGDAMLVFAILLTVAAGAWMNYDIDDAERGALCPDGVTYSDDTKGLFVDFECRD